MKMSVKAMAGVMAIVLAAGGAMAETQPWVFHDADPGKYMGMFSSIELDSLGRPHISYMGIEDNTRYVRYANYDGGVWQQETIATLGGSLTWFTSMKIDSQDNPHVGFSLSSASQYAWRGPAGWSVESVENVSNSNFASLLLADDSTPHMSYVKSGGYESSYAYRDGNGWNVEAGPGLGVLVQGLGGELHALTWANDWLHFSSYSAGVWSAPQQVSRGGFGLDVEIDTAGRMHVAHQTLGDNRLYYSVYDGDSWTSELVDGSGDAFGYAQVGLGLNPDGRPMISYQVHIDGSGGRTYVQFAEWDGSQWSLERLPGEQSAGSYGTSLAIDAVGRAYITYYSTENDEGLRVAVRAPEPATMGMLALGGLAVIRRRRRR